MRACICIKTRGDGSQISAGSKYEYIRTLTGYYHINMYSGLRFYLQTKDEFDEYFIDVVEHREKSLKILLDE